MSKALLADGSEGQRPQTNLAGSSELRKYKTNRMMMIDEGNV